MQLSHTKLFLVVVFVALACGLPACGGSSGSGPPPTPPPPPNSKITHVVIIFQENRSPDNLFNGLPGADTAQSGQNSHGQTVPLQPISLTAPYDLSHKHDAFLTEFNSGGMNGFDLESSSNCGTGCPPADVRAYGYVPRSEVQPYFTMAQTYAFADRMFQSNEGPSYPAHQYIIAATSATSPSATLLVMDNPGNGPGGCDAPQGTLVSLINPLTNDQSQQAYPCFDHPTLFDLLDAKSVSWRYYQPKLGAGIWFAPDSIQHIRYGSDYANVSTPNTNIFSDIQNGQLQHVSWVIPTPAESDHANGTDGTGPSWVAAVVNAIGNSRYWNDTVVFVTWDDWGGWYDHVRPQQYNYYELGFRVPLLVISPYAKPGYVSHVPHEFGSILKFIEETFGLGSLGYTDARADDLMDCVNFSQSPLQFRTIQSAHTASYFMHLPVDTRSPDSDF